MAKIKTFTSVRAEEHVISEAHGRSSREQAVIAAPAARILAGTVLGKVTATGKYEPLNLTAVDGTQNAAAFNQVTIDPTNPVADVRTGIHARDCEINGNKIFWPAGITAPQKAAAEAQLAANGILVRY